MSAFMLCAPGRECRDVFSKGCVALDGSCRQQVPQVKGGFIMQISKEMLIGELLQVDENMAQILMGAGMHCIGCPSSQMESLEEACMVHGIPVEKLVSVINEYLAQKQQ